MTRIDVVKYYNMQVIDSGKRINRVSCRPHYYEDIKTPLIDPTELLTERIISVDIPEKEFDRLIGNLEFFHTVPNPYERDDLEKVEHHIRKTNSAVKKAWENYRMLLKIAAKDKIPY
jgi:hypothetical protein